MEFMTYGWFEDQSTQILFDVVKYQHWDIVPFLALCWELKDTQEHQQPFYH